MGAPRCIYVVFMKLQVRGFTSFRMWSRLKKTNHQQLYVTFLFFVFQSHCFAIVIISDPRLKTDIDSQGESTGTPKQFEGVWTLVSDLQHQSNDERCLYLAVQLYLLKCTYLFPFWLCMFVSIPKWCRQRTGGFDAPFRDFLKRYVTHQCWFEHCSKSVVFDD